MRQEDLDGCHEIVKVGESTAISATCDAVLNVFINSEFTLFPTCVRAWIFEVHLLSSFHVANVDPHVLARRSQEGSVVAETDRSNLKKNSDILGDQRCSVLLGKFELTGHSNLENVLMQASSLASHTDTKASADPVAKYLPHLGIFYQQLNSV